MCLRGFSCMPRALQILSAFSLLSEFLALPTFLNTSLHLKQAHMKPIGKCRGEARVSWVSPSQRGCVGMERAC